MFQREPMCTIPVDSWPDAWPTPELWETNLVGVGMLQLRNVCQDVGSMNHVGIGVGGGEG